MKPKKNLGQNFLIDKNVIRKIIAEVKATKKDLILEIGPGKGVLTKELTKITKVIAIEIDQEMRSYLDSIQGVDFIYKDFLTVDLKSVLAKYKYDNIYIVANIPYYITTPIIKKIINSQINFKGIILMVQKEMANRISAIPKDSNYNSLTVFLNYYFNIESLFLVPKKSFYPIPKVDSAVIKMVEIKNKLNVKDYAFFEKIVKESFLHRRKTIKNNLKNYDLKIIESILEKNNYSLSSRPQDINLGTYIELANYLARNK